MATIFLTTEKSQLKAEKFFLKKLKEAMTYRFFGQKIDFSSRKILIDKNQKFLLITIIHTAEV